MNMPMRGVTGRTWSGTSRDFDQCPGQYGAIFFHSDDMIDAQWEPSIRLQLPADLPSGVYAARLRSNAGEDRVPFFVRPPRGSATAPLALLLPTFSYLAYSNDHMNWKHPGLGPEVAERVTPGDLYAELYSLHSAYDKHADGTGVCFVSRLRPLVNMRPDHRMALHGYPHQFPADLHIVDWLEEKGLPYDVITDEDVHNDQFELLAPYRVVMTGSHPEYWSDRMIAALDRFEATGGRLMYMGANGMYWVTSVDAQHPYVFEIRRGLRGTSPWRAAPGESQHSTTGEEGGLWQNRGHAPQRLLGVGMTAQGFDEARPYRRLTDSQNPRAAFIFDEIGLDEVIGDFGLVLGGAGGFELDRLDHSLGTPPHALHPASATHFSDAYQHVVEEVVMSDSCQGGSVSELVRADMTFYETPSGGAVFSVGSIPWTGSLSHNEYDNNVSQITENVLRRFLSDERFV